MLKLFNKIKSLQIGMLFFYFLFITAAVHADTAITKERTVTQVSDGIYMIRHPDAPDGFPQGNTIVIIGDKEVFVVDACYLPSSAREDIKQIREWTDKPVSYLLNTHWHMDHNTGNSVYAEEFPSIKIISHIETLKSLQGYNPGIFERYPSRAARFQALLDSGKDSNGKILTEGEKEELKNLIKGVNPVYEEFKSLIQRYPDMTFDTELNLNIGNREIQIKHLGRGNTSGDAIVYLPAEKIIIAGDLLDSPIPYLGGGFPDELLITLKKISEFDLKIIIPGHGEVLHDKVLLNNVIEFISVVVAQVSKEVYKVGNGSRNLDAVKEGVNKSIDINSWRNKFAGDNKDNQDFFDGFSLPGLITAAYAEIWKR